MFYDTARCKQVGTRSDLYMATMLTIVQYFHFSRFAPKITTPDFPYPPTIENGEKGNLMCKCVYQAEEGEGVPKQYIYSCSGSLAKSIKPFLSVSLDVWMSR